MPTKNISRERKEELLSVINQQRSNWINNYSNLSGEGFTASRKIIFSDPVALCLDSGVHLIPKVLLTVHVGGNGDGHIYLQTEDGESVILSRVIQQSEISEEVDGQICMALSFMGNELSRKMVSDIKNGPTDDIFINMLSKFFR